VRSPKRVTSTLGQPDPQVGAPEHFAPRSDSPRGDLLSIHPQRLKHRIHWISIKRSLELGEQLTWNGGNVRNAGHWQQNPLCTAIKRELHTASQILNGFNRAAKAHVAENNKLALKRLLEDSRTGSDEPGLSVVRTFGATRGVN